MARIRLYEVDMRINQGPNGDSVVRVFSIDPQVAIPSKASAPSTGGAEHREEEMLGQPMPDPSEVEPSLDLYFAHDAQGAQDVDAHGAPPAAAAAAGPGGDNEVAAAGTPQFLRDMNLSPNSKALAEMVD